MSAFGVLVAKELRVEWRRRELVAGGVVLAFLVLFIGNFAWQGIADRSLVAPGVLWVSFVFAGSIAMGRSIHAERDRGTWAALASLPVSWSTIYFAKVTANLVVLLVVEAASLAAFALLFAHDLWPLLAGLLPVLLLGSLGLVASGTLLAAVASHGRNREILLPVMLLPLMFPLLMMCVQATQKVFMGLPWQQVVNEWEILMAFDAIFLTIGWLTFEHVVGD